jgi:hypothetical protein
MIFWGGKNLGLCFGWILVSKIITGARGDMNLPKFNFAAGLVMHIEITAELKDE